MQCPKRDAKMSHHYCESWVTADDPHDPDDLVEYVTLKGYWSCDSYNHTVGESDDEYYEPED